MSDHAEYRKRAIAATNALKLAGYKVEHIEHVDVVKLYLQDGGAWFVLDLPDIAKYGKAIINKRQYYDEDDDNTLCIALQYEDNIICIFDLRQHIAQLYGVVYENFGLLRAQFMGHINGNKYVKYENVWLKEASFPFGDNKYSDVLNSNFKTAIPESINIKNDKFMMVISRLDIKDNPMKSFTFFIGPIDCIADGIYTETDGELFQYKNEEGEIFAPLFDPETEESYLVSATKNIKMTNADNCRVYCVNGLYNGYELTSNVFWVAENPNYERMELIYQYKDLFFGADGTFPGELFELSARKPGSGANTKVAPRAD